MEEKREKQKCPTDGLPDKVTRRVRGEVNGICNNGHNWPLYKPDAPSKPKETEANEKPPGYGWFIAPDLGPLTLREAIVQILDANGMTHARGFEVTLRNGNTIGFNLDEKVRYR